MSTTTSVPPVPALTTAPLRNRLRFELDASADAVWLLVGDPARLPEYSAGLARVDATRDSSGACTAYVCYFKPFAEGDQGIVSRERVRWWAPGCGYASSSDGGDAFGLIDDLNVVTIERASRGVRVTWDQYYDATDLSAMRAHFDDALGDIATRLIARFSGRVVERFVDNDQQYS